VPSSGWRTAAVVVAVVIMMLSIDMRTLLVPLEVNLVPVSAGGASKRRQGTRLVVEAS
jgi:hypothetical protein